MAILVIDDRREDLHIIRSFLENGGFRNVVSARSAEEGLEILGIEPESSPEAEIDLILLDIVMEGMNGLEACRRIKSHPSFSDTPVIIMTAETDTSNIDKAFESGAIEFLLKPVQKMELLARVRSIMHFKQKLDKLRDREKQLTDITSRLEKANERLERLSHSDGLTGIPNRRYFDYMFKKLLASALRLSAPISLLMLDIDSFKKYNDKYGHLAGDVALKNIALCLNKNVRRESDFIARYGGEEFAVVLFSTPPEKAEKLAEKIRQDVERLDIKHESSGGEKRITVSIGISGCIPGRGLTPEKLISLSDRALYRAKESGRNRVVRCDPEDTENTGRLNRSGEREEATAGMR